MKPSFSSWFSYAALIALAAGAYAYVERDMPLRLALPRHFREIWNDGQRLPRMIASPTRDAGPPADA